MNDVFGVGGVEGFGDLNSDVEKAFEFDGVAGGEMFECGAVEEFHGDESAAVFFTDVINSANVGMVEGGGGPRFTLEAGKSLVIFGDFVGEEFQRDEAMETGIFGFVDHTHTAAAKLLQD